MSKLKLPRGVHINVQEGERVSAGDPLMGGPRNPHDILDVRGEKERQKYLVNEIQEVWRLQGVNINDRHLEAISGQMMRWVRVEDIGDPPPIQSSKTSDQLYIDGHILVS